METGRSVLESMFEKLEKFLRTETVVGESFQVGEVTLIPIINVSFGIAGGEGAGKDSEGNDGKGSGTGVGCRIAPNAMLIIKGSDVSALPLTGRGSLERIMEMVPEIIAKVQAGAKPEEKSQ